MIAFRILRVCLHLFLGMWTCAVVFPFIDRAGHDRYIKRWSGKLIAICGVRVEIRNLAAQAPRALIVSNHVSWLDIFVINSVQPCRFVAKSDIRDWPLVGWLSAKTGTIFIARGRVRDVRRIFMGLVESLHAGEHVAFFPEGTTGSQGAVLPFHANLFEAAIDAKVPVQPYAVRYVDAQGNLHAAPEFIGDTTFAQSIVTILRARRITAQLARLPVIETEGAHRREVATMSRDAIAAVLGYAGTQGTV